ncbi:hypothetical protein ACH5RR_005432 [Cinchona calisaya]|uniref:Uncharacterized protein n=1 Tax=Cinchona calisaya TaxID=153742 RepID=A0ABD3AL77_9GENT
MWQVLLAAAVAGSGILAKKLIINSNAAEPSSDSKQNEQTCDAFDYPESFNKSLLTQDSIFSSTNGFQGDYSGAPSEMLGDGSIFRFSSPSGSKMGSKNLRKKMGGGYRGLKGNVEGLKIKGKGKEGKKCGGVGCGKQGWVVDQRRGGKKFYFCLKKRRISKNVTGKCESCASKGNSIFSWGLSVGMMYMMSAGKAEINRLNNSMDETAKIVQELKAELSRRKALHNQYGSNFRTEVKMNIKNIREMDAHPTITMSFSEKADNLKVFGPLIAEEGECPSSVLTEEQQPEVLEMEQLEAELESELEKLPWYSEEGSGLEGRADASETEVLAREFDPADDQNIISHQFNGVLPSELDQKLSHLLIEQQDSHILELESELQQSHSKLYEKEAELQALKDCVKRLTEFSLGSGSDGETEVQMEDDETSHGDQDINMGPESTRSMVGMKRAMVFESYDCFAR